MAESVAYVLGIYDYTKCMSEPVSMEGPTLIASQHRICSTLNGTALVGDVLDVLWRACAMVLNLVLNTK